VISFEQAMREIRQHAQQLGTERVPLAEMCGRILAEQVIAAVNLPSFDNSAMDGFALHAAHLQLPVGTPIAVQHLQLAGDAVFALGEHACQIMTGAAVPHGTVSVVPVEDVEMFGGFESAAGFFIRLKQKISAGQNIRLAGEDVQRGELLCALGAVLNTQYLMLFAALGIDTLAVRRRVKVAVFCTGEELLSDNTLELRNGQIRNSNGPYILAELNALAVDVVHYAVIPDQQDAYLQALQQAEQSGCQLIISTGAVSMGVRDFIPSALHDLKGKIIFHKVRLRPAKPSVFAILPSGALVFGLPGNPMSCAVGLRFFVQEAIRAFQGLQSEQAIAAILQTSITKKAGWQLMQKACLTISAEGQAQVSLLQGQESFRIKPFVQANVWALLPEAAVHLAQGECVYCYPMQSSGLVL
jgi:molybdopterin molybdotransferase